MSRPLPLSPGGAAHERLTHAGRPQHVARASRVAEVLGSYNLGEEASYLAWELCRWVSGLSAAEEQLLEQVVLASIVNLHQGSTRLPVRGPQASFLGSLLERLRDPEAAGDDGGLDDVQRLLDDPRLAPIVGAPGQYKPLIVDGDSLYHQRTLHFEQRLAEAFARRLRTPPFDLDAARVRAALDAIVSHRGGAPSLSAEQQLAALTALHAPLAVVTGGPGTGKTSIVVAILRLLVRLGVPVGDIALAAPTGKAAHRMKSAVLQALERLGPLDGPDAQIARLGEPRTLHRLLGYSPRLDTFRHHARNPLVERVIIVDECSMIDLTMMHQLAQATRDDARLVLLGDAEQLPSVEAGAVFRSLLPESGASVGEPWRALVRPTTVGALPPLDEATVAHPDPRARAAVRLTHSYRMDASRPEGRTILAVARALNEGHADALFAADSPLIVGAATSEDLVFRGVEAIDTSAARGRLDALLERWGHERVWGLAGFDALCKHTFAQRDGGFDVDDVERLDRLFTHHDAARILCVTRGDARPTSADAINERLHRRAVNVASSPPSLGFLAGEPVSMLHNDYGRELFNGDQGLVLQVDDEGKGPRLAVVFRRGRSSFAVFALESMLGHVQRAYAMTVHRSQGSEFDHVLLVLPDENMSLLTREVLYTAVTRARTSVVIAGRRDLIEAGARQPIERFSGVAERIVRA